MKDVRMLQIAKRKKESREIAKEVINFGVNEEQKVDIMFNIALTLENNTAMKEITEVLKKFRESINKDEQEDNNIINSPKIII